MGAGIHHSVVLQSWAMEQIITSLCQDLNKKGERVVPSLVGGYFAFFQSLWHSILIQSQTGAAVDIFQSHGKHDGMGIAWIRQRRCQNEQVRSRMYNTVVDG